MNRKTVALFEFLAVAVAPLVAACVGGDAAAPSAAHDNGDAAAAVPGATHDAGLEADAGSPVGDNDGGSEAAYGTETGAASASLSGPSHGSAIALAPDDSFAVAVNRDVGSITVVKLGNSGGSLGASAGPELAVGAEPWQVVISPDGAAAFVVLRKDQKVVKITGLGGTPTIAGYVRVGSEPTGIAMTPTGAEVWVTNWVDGTVSVVDTAAMAVKKTIDLNPVLVSAPASPLGAVHPRLALAHPRSIAISNNGDSVDADEYAYVTEYFGQQTEPEAPDGSNADVRKQGIVYRIKVADGSADTIALAPLADLGFKDERGNPAGCFPNQLQAITLNGKYAYVVSVCASPKGPTGPKVTTSACTTVADCASLNMVEAACVLPTATSPNSVCVDLASTKTTTAPLVSVIDTTTGLEVPGASASLNAKFRDLYASRNVPDNASRRFPLFASDIDFVPGSGVGYVSANGADAVFRIRYDAASGAIVEVGASTNVFIDLNPQGISASKAGLNPIGLAIAHSGRFAIVPSEVTRVATVVEFTTQAVSGGPASPLVVQLTAPPAPGSEDEQALQGKRFFNTGMGRWSLKGQGWGACQSCHSDGLTDNVTWYFARGPRQSTSLDGTFNKHDLTDQRILNWTGINDELADFEGNTRGISGGVGAIVLANSSPPVTADRIDVQAAVANNLGLNGSAAKAADPNNPLGLAAPSKLANWANITKYVQTIRSPRAVVGLDPYKVAAGAALFAQAGSCAGCHSGGKWTISHVFYDPTPATMTALKAKAFPALNGFPTALLPATTAANQVMRFAGADPAKAGAFDQILCAMRPVGTFNVAEPGAGIAELRIDMATPAQGNGDANGDGKGFNVPSLLGLASGAPYFHGGNARTLEAAFSTTFAAHHQSLAPNFLTDSDPGAVTAKVDELVAYLLSIDIDTQAPAVPAFGAAGGDFCQGP